MMSIKEKYAADVENVDRNILKTQMNFAEIQLQEILFKLTATFRQDIVTLNPNCNESDRIQEINLYREVLRNSLFEAKDELRRSFKENGFIDMSEIEFSSYIKMKFAGLLTIGKEYMSQHYIETNKTIVLLSHRFSTFDRMPFEEMAFLCYRNAKQVMVDAKKKREELKIKFHKTVDRFLKQATKGSVPDGN